jgi:hypothetical protein
MNEIDPNEPSKGLGDSIAKLTHALGLDKVADTVAQALGQKDCGCEARRKAFNEWFPYKDGIKMDVPEQPSDSIPSPTPTIIKPEDYQFEGVKKYLIHKEFSITDSNTNMTFRFLPGHIVDITNSDSIYPNLMKLIQTQYISVFDKDVLY